MLVFGQDAPPQKPKKQKQASVVKRSTKTAQVVNRLYDEVMQLGSEYHYQELHVNNSLIIGEGVWCWQAYAELAVEKRIVQIKAAIRRQNETRGI